MGLSRSPCAKMGLALSIPGEALRPTGLCCTSAVVPVFPVSRDTRIQTGTRRAWGIYFRTQMHHC